jgi:hypothetical protein
MYFVIYNIVYYVVLCQNVLHTSCVRLNEMRNDTDAPPLPSELERVCRSCLVPSLPSNRKDINVEIVYVVMLTCSLLPSELERVCRSCLVPSLPSNRKDINVEIVYVVMLTRLICRASWKEFAEAA